MTEEVTLPSADIRVWNGKFDLKSIFQSGITVIVYGTDNKYELKSADGKMQYWKNADAISGLGIDTDNHKIFAKVCHVSPSMVAVGDVLHVDGLPVRVMSIRFSG